MSNRTASLVALALVSGLTVVVFILSQSRSVLSFGVETDFLDLFVPEASRFLSGTPMTLAFHPPLYSIVIGYVQSVTHDWFSTGRVVSLISAASVMISSYYFFSIAFSRAAGLGALIALGASPLFLSYAAFATSDLFFLALYYLSLLTMLHATRMGSPLILFLAGVLVGATLLTRTNGIVLGLLLLVPWLESSGDFKRKLSCGLAAAFGVVTPLILWIVYARATGSPIKPSATFMNLAMTFFRPEGLDRPDALVYLGQRFHTIGDVLLHDPARLVRVYLSGLFWLPSRLSDQNSVFAYPMNLLILPVVLYLLYTAVSRWAIYTIVLTGAHVALVGLKTFEPRFYLFVIPLLGAGFGQLVGNLLGESGRSLGTAVGRSTALFIIAGITCISVANAISHTDSTVRRDEIELSEVIRKARDIIPEGAIIVARKQHLAFYAGGEFQLMPSGRSIDDLRASLESIDSDHPIFVYYGGKERLFRPEYSELLGIDQNVPFLTLRAHSDRPRQWTLYQFNSSKETDIRDAR